MIKRENFKGKYYLVARDDKGHILARVKWEKKLNTNTLKKTFSQNRSFSKDVKRTKLKKVYEIEQSPKSFSPGRRGANYSVTIKFKSGEKISAKSLKFYTKSQMKDARDQAFENLSYRVSEAFGEAYDKDIGDEILQKKRGQYQITERVVRYANA